MFDLKKNVFLTLTIIFCILTFVGAILCSMGRWTMQDMPSYPC